jgi:hypothetical protein
MGPSLERFHEMFHRALDATWRCRSDLASSNRRRLLIFLETRGVSDKDANALLQLAAIGQVPRTAPGFDRDGLGRGSRNVG